ncbi:MAG: cob(I)yrinic acid a,c-diamide adenosyltransferase [Saccharofermentanales bacterium]|jgi:cob(I)alamin adenosyltransferase
MTAKKEAATKEDSKAKQGLIHLYFGTGKGKTTASVGLATRARGRQFSVLFVTFLKPGTSGELDPLRAIGVDVLSGQPVRKFVYLMTEEEKEETRRSTEALFQQAVEACQHDVDLVIFDEIVGVLELEMLNEQDVLHFLKTKPPHLEVVLTGRNPSQSLINAADYASEIVMRKHPYETSGIMARKGIEF